MNDSISDSLSRQDLPSAEPLLQHLRHPELRHANVRQGGARTAAAIAPAAQEPRAAHVCRHGRRQGQLGQAGEPVLLLWQHQESEEGE